MQHVKTIYTGTKVHFGQGCGECQTSCQSACKTSCTVANQSCERIDARTLNASVKVNRPGAKKQVGTFI